VTGLLAAAAGAAFVAGLPIAVAGVRRTVPRGGRSRRDVASRLLRLDTDSGAWPGSRWRIWRWPTVVTSALSAWLLTGWPVAGLIAGATIVGLPILLMTGRQAARSIDRLEAVEEWTRRLADVLIVGIGLEQAIAATVRTCPDMIRAEVGALAARLNARWPTETALRAFAEDVRDATGDLVTAALILGARRRGPGLARVLTAVADSVAEEVAMRRKIEAERAKPRTTARAVTLITLGVVAVGSLNGDYLRPYGTPLGQLVLAAIAACFVAALSWMRALTLAAPAPRILARGSSRPGPGGARS
jgi:tight adherence protein B